MEKRELRMERDKELKKRFDYVIQESGVNPRYMMRDDIANILQSMPAPRFYIDWKIAQNNVNLYYKGKMKHKSELKQKMVLDLVEVFEEVRSAHMNYPMTEIWNMVVEHPAKSFYLSKQRIIEIIYNYHDNGRKKTDRQ